jgi:hypothetical protein
MMALKIGMKQTSFIAKKGMALDLKNHIDQIEELSPAPRLASKKIPNFVKDERREEFNPLVAQISARTSPLAGHFF